MTTTDSQSGVSSSQPPDLHPTRLFEGARLVVVGGTGFLGKVWVSMLLARFPSVGHLYLLVRPKEGQSVEERFWQSIMPSAVFDPVREQHPGDAFEKFIREKITPVAGDMVHDNLGLSDELIAEIDGQVAAVVNVAGVVDFNPPLDEALEVNAFGVNNLVSLAKRLNTPVLHTSTCYVAGYRSGIVEEVDPRSVPFPRVAGEMDLGEEAPDTRTLDRSHWDPQREIDECLDLVRMARHRCEDAFRQSAFLDQAKHNLQNRGEPCRGTPLELELAKVKRKFISDRLSNAGIERAKYWGWTNIYTYTKSIGEQVLAASGVPYTIVRPAVVESSMVFPFTGWNEGINTSAPFIFMASKGQVQFPGSTSLDIIPVDMVAAGMIGSLAELLDGTQKPVYHYGSSDSNLCSMQRFLELIGLYKRKLVFDGKKTKVFDYVSAYFEPRGLTKKEYEQRGAHALAGAMRGVGGVLKKTGVGPLASVFKPVSKALLAAAKTEDKTGDVMDLFVPFTCEKEYVFSCANTRAMFDRMPPEERELFEWWPEKIDWRQFMFDVHLPGLDKWVMPLIEEKMQRELKPRYAYDQLLDLIDEMAERHDHAVALSRVEPEGLTRITYRYWRDVSHVVAAALMNAGVDKGDRVLLSGLNHPAWPLAYFGILRAGAVAVPVDAGLDANAFSNILRSCEAKVAIWDQEVEGKVGASIRDEYPDLQTIDLRAVAEVSDAEAAQAYRHPIHVPVEGSDVASVIYTSGTTGQPKGVMLTHQNFTSLLAALTTLFPLTHRDRVLSVLPLHHTFEFTCGLLLPMSAGARVVYLRDLTAEDLNEGLSRGRITGMVGVPALWQMLERRVLSRVREQGTAATTIFDWGSELNRLLGRKVGLNAGRMLFSEIHKGLGGNMRHLISGGAALPKETAEFFAGLGLPMAEGYGLTEAAPVLTVSKASMKAKPGQVGKPVPGVEIKIDQPDKEGVGEILARGPNVMAGYAGDDEATKETIDTDGWLHTGDLGKLDRRDRLVIVGRNKDVIVTTSGENVYPDDVETMLGAVDGVRELAIVGIDDNRGGERVGCLAVPDLNGSSEATNGAEPPEERAARQESAMKALRKAFEKLPRVAQPAVTHLYETDLPRTATRKVKRPEVRAVLERLISATSGPVSAPGQELTTMVRHAVATIANRPAGDLKRESSLRGDLGFDSLMNMELGTALEAKLGHTVDSAALNACETVGDVERLVGESKSMARTTKVVEEEPEVPRLPQPVADAAKRVLTRFQMGFYDQVMKPKVYGRAFIPHNRNTIVVSNHSSHLDMGFVKYALGTYGDGIVSLAAQDYFFKDKWRRAYFDNLTNLAAFDRKSGLRAGLRQSAEIIERGHTLLLFPEGTRSTDGVIREFKPAVAHLALTQGVDILPVYLGGTYEAMPKGSRLPVKRDIVARIGPPLRVSDLERLTQGMKFAQACRKVAALAREAVVALKEGKVLDISQLEDAEAVTAEKAHPMVSLFKELESKFVAGSVEQPITFYFTLGNEKEAKWTLSVDAQKCEARLGKPEGAQADCVLKTSQEIFTKIVRESYTPSPMEFMSGAIKSNDIALLQTFQKVFALA